MRDLAGRAGRRVPNPAWAVEVNTTAVERVRQPGSGAIIRFVRGRAERRGTLAAVSHGAALG